MDDHYDGWLVARYKRGDLVAELPHAVQALREQHPDATFTWIPNEDPP